MTTTHRIPVPGAVLHHQVRGSGPLLLVLQGGDGDADRTHDLVDQLVDHHTVVTYDRRGLARSRVDNPAEPVTTATHADDVHRLLAALTDEPARLLGSSFGALIGLELARAHPGQVHTLVAHEPPALRLLPAAWRSEAAVALDRLDATYRTDGWAAGFRELAAITGAGFADREPQVALPGPPSGRRLADLDFFFTRDLPAMRASTFDGADLAAIEAGPVRIVPAVGATTAPGFFDHRCAVELARRLAQEVAEFPGGHNGLTSHPRAFAARLREVLGS
jgi:pimeloyl-ACP methyl ester carboxylesterase